MFVTSHGRGRLERCELWGNADGGVYVQMDGDLILATCTLRDHVAGRAAGVYVSSTAAGRVTVGADCVFARNDGGDVVRQEEGDVWDDLVEEEDDDFEEEDA